MTNAAIITNLSKKHSVAKEFVTMFFNQNNHDEASTEIAIINWKKECSSY